MTQLCWNSEYCAHQVYICQINFRGSGNTGPIFCRLIKIHIQTTSIFLELLGVEHAEEWGHGHLYSSRPDLCCLWKPSTTDALLPARWYCRPALPIVYPGRLEEDTVIQSLLTLSSKSEIAQRDHPRKENYSDQLAACTSELLAHVWSSNCYLLTTGHVYIWSSGLSGVKERRSHWRY